MFFKRLAIFFLLGGFIIADDTFIEKPKKKKQPVCTKENIVESCEQALHNHLLEVKLIVELQEQELRTVRSIADGVNQGIIGKGSRKELDKAWGLI